MSKLTAPFPAARFRRARKSPAIRALMAENEVAVNDLIWPVFLTEATDTEEPAAPAPLRLKRATCSWHWSSITQICSGSYEGMSGS